MARILKLEHHPVAVNEHELVERADQCTWHLRE